MGKKRNKIIFFILKAAVSLIALYLVLKKAGLRDVVSLLKEIKLHYFLLATFFYVSSVFVSSIRWHLLASVKKKSMGVVRHFFLYMIGAFFNNLLPGVIGGDTVRIYYLYKETSDASTAFGSTFLDRYTGYAGLLLVGLFATILGYNMIKETYIVWLIPALAGAFVLGSLIIFSLRVGRRFSLIGGFYDYFLSFFRNKTLIIKTLMLSVVIQSITIFSVYVITKGIGAEVSSLELFIFLPLIITATAVPISISGIGIREAGFVILLGLSGVSPQVATTISFAWFLSQAFGALPGSMVYLFWRSKTASKMSVSEL